MVDLHNARYSLPLTRKRSNLKELSTMAENVTKVPVKQKKIENHRHRCKRGSPLKLSAMRPINHTRILTLTQINVAE